MAGWDLNRQWRHPEAHSSPTIYWTKALLKWMCEDLGKKPIVSKGKKTNVIWTLTFLSSYVATFMVIRGKRIYLCLEMARTPSIM
jgi:hypothetical protein